MMAEKRTSFFEDNGEDRFANAESNRDPRNPESRREEPDIGSTAAGPTATLSQIADVVVVLNRVRRSAAANQLGKCKSKHLR